MIAPLLSSHCTQDFFFDIIGGGGPVEGIGLLPVAGGLVHSRT
jgi:hypothetical protein